MSRRGLSPAWVVAVALTMAGTVPAWATTAPPVAPSDSCQSPGCMPTPEDCAAGAPPVTLGWYAGSLAVCAAGAGHTVAYAGGNPTYPCGEVTVADTDAVPGDANECDRHVDEPLDTHVYTPQGTPTQGLPSLYLLTGAGGNWQTWQDYGFQPQQIADRYRMVVVAVGGQTSYYVNWADGTVKAERQLMSIIRRVDARYGTSTSATRRGVLGFSMGGYGAALMAERHPSLFGAVVSLSGVLNIENPAVKANIVSWSPSLNRYSTVLAPNRIWGDPVTNDSHWRAMNPTDHVCGLRRAWIWFSTGDGVPAAADAGVYVPTSVLVERMMYLAGQDFARALKARGLQFTFVVRHGVHSSPYWISDVAQVLPQLAHRLATGAPPQQPKDACR